MTFGAEFKNAGGIVRLAPEDFVYRMAATGATTLVGVSGTSRGTRTISAPGVSLDGNWDVVVYGPDCRAYIESGQFTIVGVYYGAAEQYSYALYRR